MKKQIHFAIQIVPIAKSHDLYKIIDKAIDIIKQSGLRYEVGLMETVIQGDYDTVLAVAKKAQQVCFDAGADEIVVNMKVHARKDSNVTWEEKNTGLR